MASVEDLDKFAQQSAERANEISSDYSKNTSLIIDKLIVISLGTSSLLFTFIGVLYSSNRAVSDLEFKYLVLAIGCFIVAAIFLLLARWFPWLYRHSMAQKYHLMDLKSVESKNIELLDNTQLINARTGKAFTDKEAKSYRTKLNKQIAKIEDGIARSKKEEKNYHRLYRYTFLAGVISILAGYVLTTIFSVGIIELLNK